MDLVDEINLAVALAELIFGVNQNQALLGSHLRTAGKQCARVALHRLIVFLRNDALLDYFLARDILVVSGFSLGGRSDDRFREFLVFLHALRQFHAAKLTATSLIVAPSAARKIAADNHLYAESLTFQSHSDHRVGSGKFPVWNDVGCSVKECCRNLVEHLPFERNALRKNHVESRDTVCRHHHHQIIVDVIHIAYFPVINAHLSRELEICLY